MSYPWRCCNQKCRKAKQLTYKLHTIAIVQGLRCKCGGSMFYNRSLKHRHKQECCKCDGLHWPHRIGTSVWCIYHPIGPTNKDWEERYGYET